MLMMFSALRVALEEKLKLPVTIVLSAMAILLCMKLWAQSLWGLQEGGRLLSD